MANLTEINYVDNSPEGAEKNVSDFYKKWTTDAIKADLDTHRSRMVNICMNLTGEFNKSSVVRSNNAFLGQEVWMIGKRTFNRKGTVGTHHYEHIKHCEEIEPVFEHLHANGYTIYAVDNIPEYNPIAAYDVKFPEKSAFVYGEEMLGLSEKVIKMCDAVVYIEQYGSVRSINVAQAASVLMYEYRRQHRNFDN